MCPFLLLDIVRIPDRKREAKDQYRKVSHAGNLGNEPGCEFRIRDESKVDDKHTAPDTGHKNVYQFEDRMVPAGLIHHVPGILDGEGDRRREQIPYLDDSLFLTSPENHIFIAQGIRSAGLHAQEQTLFTTNNPAIPIVVWVWEVLKGNYRKYLEETAAAIEYRRRLKDLEAPALRRFRKFYHAVVRDETYKKKTDYRYRGLKNDGTLEKEPVLRKKFDEIYSEIDWLEREYRSMMSESYGLFSRQKSRKDDKPRPVFRPEPESKIIQLQECVKVPDPWEASFVDAIGRLEREIAVGKKRKR